MSIYQIDRIQHLPDLDEFCVFEFIKLDSSGFAELKKEIQELLDTATKENKELDSNDIWIIIYKYSSTVMKEKLEYLGALYNNWLLTFWIILYDQTEADFCLIILPDSDIKFLSFDELQAKFLEKNGQATGVGKELGVAQSAAQTDEEEPPDFVNKILQEIEQDFDVDDDSGLSLTKRLLSGVGTCGFDFDLSQYIESTGEFIIYEFLRNNSPFVSNYSAHPMRYCWRETGRDNKQKFISLWKAKQKFNARLYLVNYSDESVTKGVGISEVIGVDEKKGFVGEKKYYLTYLEFIEWMKMMNNYNCHCSDYLSSYNCKREVFHETYFAHFNEKKGTYGIPMK